MQIPEYIIDHIQLFGQSILLASKLDPLLANKSETWIRDYT